MNLTAISQLEFVGDAEPYVYIGDSHAMIGNLLFTDPATSERIVTVTYTRWGFNAHDFLDEDELLGVQLTQILRTCGVLHNARERDKPVPGLRPVRTKLGRGERDDYLEISQYSSTHPHVISVGELDAREILRDIVVDSVDFAVPFELGEVETLANHPNPNVIEFRHVMNVVLSAIGPVLRGLRILREAGFETLYLHSLAPPTLDAKVLSKLLNYPVPLRVYYKLTMLINLIYERACNDIGIGFINTWPLVTEGNLRKPEYELDPIHLNRAHTLLSIQEVHRQFTAKKGA